MLNAIFAVLFGLSLLPGRKPLCLRFAEQLFDGFIPVGAESYCRKLTWVWFFVLTFGAAATISLRHSILALFVSPVLFFTTFAIEMLVRNRRFSVIFKTSGSTGTSKTIVKTFAMLAKEVSFHRDWYRVALPEFSEPRDVTFLGTIQWDHMYGKLWMDLLPRAFGSPAPREVISSPEMLIAKMSAAKYVFLVTTPSFLEHFLAYAEQYTIPNNCIEIVTSGSRLNDELAEQTAKVFGIRPRQIYGSTETGGIAWLREGNVAQVFAPVKVSTVGQRLLVKKSPFSYKQNYLMGDGVEMSSDRRSFKLLGRLDRLVKIREERVNLAEMEDKVRELGFKDAALAVLESSGGAQLGLVVVGEPIAPLEMRARLLPLFPLGTVPKKFRFVREIPKNAQGKVLKSEIEKMF